MKKIWGIEFNDEYVDGYIFRRVEIKNPFQKDDDWFVGLNEKFLLDTIERKIHKLILKVGEKEIIVAPPNKKEIKQMVKEKMFEDRKSMFQGSPDMRIYHWKI